MFSYYLLKSISRSMLILSFPGHVIQSFIVVAIVGGIKIK